MTAITERARGIRLLVLDVDGVLTDGRLYIPAQGDELKCFHVRDGHGLKSLQRSGCRVAVISGRRSEAVVRRMRELGIESLHQGIDDKLSVFESLLQQFDVEASAVACVGDDTVDVPILERAGFAIAVADAHDDARAVAHYITRARGGRGAVREVCDLLLAAHGAPS
ncbi:MAG TPA: 3-deoxy-manno-octulosonate-8-phosphatase KdsC [Steroidobacteraceae bacterium]|nr:3-deoxy-manno-octulosonate-8-phosphatase KdsC [Steroidobacteraceae bacterium]